MALYFLTYDLRNPGKYQAVYAKLEKLGAVRILESTWCFGAENTTAATLRDQFKSLVDGDDGLVVSQVTSWASSNTENTPKDL